MVKTLVIASQSVVDGSVLSSLLKGGLTALSNICFATQADKLQKGALPPETYAVAFSFAENAESHTPDLLTELLGSLLPGGTLTIVEKGHQDTGVLEKKLILAGFVGCKSTVSPTGDALVEAQRPSWQAGTKAAINLKPKAVDSSAAQQQRRPVWNLTADGDDDLVDDEELLTEEDRLRPSAPAADCGTSVAKKACKDCTCGRAEGKMEKVELTPELLENPQSGCGSCGLGDAFRCASCPYRGLPAFEKGKKLELPSNFLTADA